MPERMTLKALGVRKTSYSTDQGNETLQLGLCLGSGSAWAPGRALMDAVTSAAGRLHSCLPLLHQPHVSISSIQLLCRVLGGKQLI